MRELIDNSILQGVLVALIVAFLFWGVRIMRWRRDEKKILTFLYRSKAKTEHGFRSTYAISSDTNLTEGRVGKICSESKKIRRNQKELQSWALIEHNR